MPSFNKAPKQNHYLLSTSKLQISYTLASAPIQRLFYHHCEIIPSLGKGYHSIFRLALSLQQPYKATRDYFALENDSPPSKKNTANLTSHAL